MKVSLKKYLMIILPIIYLSSCVTVNGPLDFVEYKIPKGAKKSIQSSRFNGNFNEYYNEEFTYDQKGNVIKVKQINHINPESKNKKFTVWEVEWKVYGDYVVPYKASCNGVTYCTIEWQVLATNNKGKIKQDLRARHYYKTISGFMSSSHEYWLIDLKQYPVPFNTDNKFVKELISYNIYGKHESRILTFGYDNIVIKKYNFSYEKLTSGVIKTNPSWTFTNYQLKNISRNSEVEFNFLWKVIAEKPCLEQLKFNANLLGKKAKFEANMTYNYNGNRQNEEWIVFEKKFGDEKRIKVFEQSFTY